MGSTPVKTEIIERCQERERLLREWTQCGRRLAKLFEEHPVTMTSSDSDSAAFEDQIRIAKVAEAEASRAYHLHVISHDCV